MKCIDFTAYEVESKRGKTVNIARIIYGGMDVTEQLKETNN